MTVHALGEEPWRLVRRGDDYLRRFDGYGVPEWVPRKRATKYPTRKMAHAMKRIAERYEGIGARIVVVRLVPPIGTGEGT
jgi:hypothetical protein